MLKVEAYDVNAVVRRRREKEGALQRLDRLDLGLVGVESAVRVRERGALLERDGPALVRGNDGARSRHEGERDSDEGGLAEHGRCRCDERRVNELKNAGGEQEMSW